MPNEIVHQASGGALNAEHYQTYEMAKQNDTILGSDNIAQIRSYAAYARAQAQAIHKTIAATNGIEDVAAMKSEVVETEQTYAKVSVYADQRVGEILRELPKAQGKRTDITSLPTGKEVTKAEAIEEAGFTPKTAAQLEKLAANPDVVQAVIDKATADGTVVSRAQVLKAIRERDQLKEEVEALEKQNDKLYEQVENASEPKVIEREVVPEDYAEAKKRVRQLEEENSNAAKDYDRLAERYNKTREELAKARDVLGMSQSKQDVRRDVQYLITSTNNYIRQYGGLTWTFEQLEQVDAPTLKELEKAAKNLATFATALVANLEGING